MKTVVCCLIVAAGLLLAGCGPVLIAGAAAGAGAGGVLYAKGDLDANIKEPYEKTVEAARDAIEEIGLHMIEEKDLVTEIVFTCRRTDDKKVAIRIISVTPDLTRVNIRVGVFGDEDFSRYVYGKIKEQL